MARLQQITRAAYQVKVQWECELDDAALAIHEKLTHPTVRQSPMCYRDALYAGRTKAMRLHYKAREGETIQHVDEKSLYTFICKYFTFAVGHPVIHVGDACKEKEACLGKKGLIIYSTVPPEWLYHPVFPFRANQNLMFSLCRTCVLTSNTGDFCHKTDEERAWLVRWSLSKCGWPSRRGTEF